MTHLQRNESITENIDTERLENVMTDTQSVNETKTETHQRRDESSLLEWEIRKIEKSIEWEDRINKRKLEHEEEMFTEQYKLIKIQQKYWQLKTEREFGVSDN